MSFIGPNFLFDDSYFQMVAEFIFVDKLGVMLVTALAVLNNCQRQELKS